MGVVAAGIRPVGESRDVCLGPPHLRYDDHRRGPLFPLAGDRRFELIRFHLRQGRILEADNDAYGYYNIPAKPMTFAMGRAKIRLKSSAYGWLR